LTPPSKATDVFVVGGGPAGLAAAIAARRIGLDVTVADWSRPPIDKACGEGIMPDGIAAATALGIRLEDAGGFPFSGIRFCDGDCQAAADFPNGYGLGLRRTALHRLMAEQAHAAGVRLLWDTRVAGLREGGVDLESGPVRARWVVGADGGNSQVRRWARLDACLHNTRRFGFRRHYRVGAWSDSMELHWAHECQLYVTPVAPEEICVALVGRDSSLRLERALALFPALKARLASAHATTAERGGISASRRLKSVYRGRVALVGDASGTVDAITGEGLCLLFEHAAALARAMAADDLAIYQAEHRRIGRRPALMADLLLTLGRSRGLRERVMKAMAGDASLFARMLAIHIGERPAWDLAGVGLRIGWQFLHS